MNQDRAQAVRRWFGDAGLALLLPVLVLAIYWQGLGGGFLFDDFPNIVTNVRLHVTGLGLAEWVAALNSSPAADLQRPLAMFTFAVNHYFTGLDPWPMKLTNVAIHALNSLLVFSLARRLFDAARSAPSSAGSTLWPALFVGACWALHPINLSGVLLVVQRMEILSHSFVFAGLILYLVGRRRQLAGRPGFTPIVLGMVACTGVGMLAKESAALLPVYALLLEGCLFGFKTAQGGKDRRILALFAVVLVVPAVLGCVWLFPRILGDGAYALRNFGLAERLLTEPRVLVDYLHWTLLPDLGQLSLYHDDYPVSRGLLQPVSTLVSIVALVAWLASALWIRRQRPLVGLAMLWFLAAHLLTATVIPLELVFEHRNYFASLAIMLILGDLLFPARPSASLRKLGWIVAVALALFYAGVTGLRAVEWGNPVQLSRSEAQKHPLSPRATYDWGKTLVVIGDYDRDAPATQAAFDALEAARRTPGSNILPNQALLILAARTDTPIRDEWWDEIYNKLLSHPVGPQERSAVASLAICSNEGHCRFSDEAMAKLFSAALAQGEDPEILSIFAGYVLARFRDAGRALDLWERAAQINPNEGQFRINRAILLIALGHKEPARAEISRIRGIGRHGQYEASADELQGQLDASH